MKLAEFINLIEDSNVSLSLDENENIKVSAPKGVLKKEHFDALKRFKPDLIQHLISKQVIDSDEIESSISQEKRKMGYKVLCSTMQKGMWLNSRLQTNSSVYNMSGAFEIFGELHMTQLELAFQHLIAEHDVLRTRILENKGELWQSVEPKSNFTVNVFEIATEELNACIEQEATHVFDLEQSGLLRASVYQLGDKHQVLVLTLHHIIADGWSLQLMVKHLNTFYTDLLNQSATVSSPFHLQYADFTQWQLNQLNLGKYQKQLDYWNNKLADQSPLLSIPTDRPRPAKQDFNGDSVPITLPHFLKSNLEGICKEQGVTLFMLLLAGFKVFLARYSHVSNISIGTPVANRSQKAIENVLGIFVNTVVVRSEVETDTIFSQFLSHVKETLLDAYANSQVPFEHVVSEVNPERSASFHPLCQVLFSFQNQDETQVQLGDLNCQRLPHHSQTSRVDMTLMLNVTDKNITGHIEYATALFDRTTIEQLTESFVAFMGDLSENANKKIHEYTLLNQRQHHLLNNWQGRQTQYPKHIDWQVSSFASKQPNAIAVSCEDRQMTYAELEKFSNNLAETIINQGVEKGALIGVLLHPCLELPGILLAIMKAECSYVPLDPRYPENRLNLMINDSGISTLIGTKDFKDKINQQITFHDVKSLITINNQSVSHYQSSQSNLLCIKYTSGSTGVPKGVRLTHQNILRLVINSDVIALNKDTVMLQYASLSFDASALEIWGTLTNGGRLIIADSKQVSPADLSDFLKQQPINTAFFTTSLFNELMTAHADVLSKLKLIMAGGEAFNHEQAQKVISLLPNTKVINGYGPTENAVFSCCHQINEKEDYQHTVPIGHCVNNSSAYVLDKNQQLLPSGAVGELWVGGDGLAEGYHDKKQLTSERFVWHKSLNQRLYRTGDIARMRHDGQLIYLGRTDNQVKIRGYRIEIEEIEAQLLALPGITHTAVFCEGKGATKHLIAYVRIESQITKNDVQVLLHKVLPAYMIPSEFRLIDNVPYNKNGKLDRAALKEIKVQPLVEETLDVSELQKEVLNIWKQTLNVNHVNLNTNFFHAGGNSLTAIRLLAKVRSHFSVSIPAAEFLTNPTPTDLTRLIEESTCAENFKKIEAIPLNSKPVLSLGQSRLWLLQQISQGDAIFNMSAGIHFQGPLDIKAIKESLSEMVESHRIFRSRIVSQDGVPELSYHQMNWELKTQRDTLDPETNQLQFLTGLVNQTASKDFDLANDWLLRAKLYTFSEQEHFLVLCIHHIISDGWSVGLMLSELNQRYTQKYAQKTTESVNQAIVTNTKCSPKIQYHDFAYWQQNLIESTIYQDQLDYWCQKLKDIPPAVSLPYKAASQKQQQFQGQDCSVVLSNKLCDSINKFASANNLSDFTILLTVFHAIIARLSDHEDVTIGIPSAGRNHQETENMLGFFVNTLAIRNQWDLSDSFKSAVMKMATSINAALSHQDVPYDRVVNAVKPTHGRGDDGLFNVFFNRLNLPSSEIKLPQIKQQIIQADDSASKFDLTLYLKECDSGLSIRARFNALNYTDSQIQELLNQYQFALEQAMDSPENSVNSWSLYTKKAQKLTQANATKPPKYSQNGVIEFFEKQVVINPDLTAISDNKQVYSYKQLSLQSDKLAQSLIKQGYKTGDVIAIYAGRNAELIISILAILKIKGVFVVLDSSYPTPTIQDRINAVSPSGIIQSQTDMPEDLLDYLKIADFNLIDPHATNDLILDNNTIDLSVHPSDTAYMAFTSGTSGKSRVVIGTHRGLERTFLNWYDENKAFKTGAKFSMLSGLGHDPLHRDIFLALSTGGQICIPGLEDIEPIKLGQWFSHNGIEIANLTPAMLSLILLGNTQNLNHLKCVLSVGEALPWSLVQTLKNVSNADVYNLYGTTETQQCLSRFLCPKDSQTSHGYVPIGSGLSGTQIMSLLSDGKPAGIGEMGEIAIISDGIAKGYLHSENHAFFRTELGHKGYKTGDKGMFQVDGSIKILGRSDRQISIRGFRVEPAEIEQVLVSLQDIDSAHVCIKQSPQGQELLLAYIKTTKPEQAQDYRHELQQKLPAYMMPTSIVQLEEFPRSPNGKIDVCALPLPHAPALSKELGKDHMTTIIAESWAKVLDIEKPKYDVDFFQLGGHSLLAARVIAHLQSELQVTISLKEFFRSTQLSKLIQLVKNKQHERKDRFPIIAIDRNECIPLSLQQNRLWVLNELNLNKNLYNISGAYRLSGTLNSQALETAFKHLIERHEILRTSFRKENGQPYQHIIDDMNFSITEQSVMKKDLAELVKQEAQTEFNIEKAPLIRAKILTLACKERILLITFHHLVFDGGSWGILIDEISQNYNSVLNKTTPNLAKLPVQFGDYAHWQRKSLNSELLSEQSDYWTKQLMGLSPLLQLPTKQPRPAIQRYQGDLVSIELGNQRLQKLLQFSQSHGVTLHMTLLTVFQVMLAKLSGQNDIAVGTPIANRNHVDLENLIGFFVNTLVIRNKIEPTENFLVTLQNLKETTLNAYENQDMPFEQIVEALQPERSLSNSPLFQVLFSLQNTPVISDKLNGISIKNERYQSHSSRFDLVLNLQQTDNDLRGYLEYDTDLFEKTTIARWLNHYVILIDSILIHANRPIHSIPMLSVQEKTQLQQFSSGPIKPIESHAGIHGLIENQFIKQPNSIAIRQGQMSISYAELNDKAERIARWLQNRGLNVGDRVGVNLKREIEFFIVMLAILKAGGNYVPIDPTYPHNRQKFIAEDAELFLLISESILPFDTIDNLTLSDVLEQSATGTLPELKRYQDYSDLSAYMIYTSGSTGKPKGVSIQHGGLCNMVVDQIEAFGLSKSDRILQLASLSFDVSIKEIFLALASGACLVLPKEQNHNSVLESLQSELCEQKVTTAILLPTVLPHLNPDELPDLRLVYTGAEVVPAQVATHWSKGRRFVNAYGPTECTVMATSYECSINLNVDPPIGRPIANTHVVVLSEHNEWCGIGIAGEICILGPGVAGSYWRQNETTGFANLTFNGETQTMYRTGDMGCWLEDGNLQFMGRKDKQIKIRGFRIEIDEIVAVLQQCQFVNEVVVIVDEGTPHSRLLAYYVGDTSVDSIRDHAKSILPSHMIPSAFMQLATMPHTDNRKVDYSQLPAIEISESKGDKTLPRNAIEKALVTCWSTALGVKHLGIFDNFFEVGGDSILALQAVSLSRQAGIEITAQQIFEYQNIAELTSVCQLSTHESNTNHSVTGPVLLTPIQQWFFAEVQQHVSWFNQGLVLRLKKNLSGDQLINAFNKIVQHHDILRAQYLENHNQWHQSIPAFTGDNFTFIEKDLSVEFQQSGSECIADFCSHIQAQFDLKEGRLLTAALVHLEPSESRLIVFAHHLVVDGVSWRIILEDLQALCLGNALLPNTASYQEYANQCNEITSDPEWTKQRQYWLNQLQNQHQIPLDKSGINSVGSSQNFSFELSSKDTETLLQSVSLPHKLSVNDLLLAALLKTLQHWSQKDAISINMESHGRSAFQDQVNLTRTVGWCTSLYPLLFDLKDLTSDETFLQYVKDTTQSVPHQGLGFGLLEFSSDSPLTGEKGNMPEIGFNYLGQFDQTFQNTVFEPAPETTGNLSHKEQIRTQKLSVNALVKNNRMKINWIYSQNLHFATTIEYLAAQFEQHLLRLIKTCQSVEPYLRAEDFVDTDLNQDELDDLLNDLDF